VETFDEFAGVGELPPVMARIVSTKRC